MSRAITVTFAQPVKRALLARSPAQIAHHHCAGCASRGTGASRAAFTLIELLLAVAIFAIALLAIHGVFYGAIKLQNRTAAALDAAVPLHHAVTIIKRDLANIVPPGAVLAGPLQTTPTTTEANLLGSALPALGVAGRQVGPEFHTATGLLTDQTPWADIQRVAYYLVEPTNNVPGKDLVRVVWRNLLPVLSEQPEGQWLMSGVQDVVFAFFDGMQWTSMWDSTAQDPALPLAVRVQIQLVGGQTASINGTEPVAVELLVPITVQARSNQLSNPVGMAL